MIRDPAKRAAGMPDDWKLVIVAAALVTIAGCGDGYDGPETVPLAGKVTLNGQPLEGADITFFNDEYETGMLTMAGGVYSIPTGAVPGDYKVTISKMQGLENAPEGLAIAPDPSVNPQLLPPQYSDRSQTMLTFTVPPEGTPNANFDLRTE